MKRADIKITIPSFKTKKVAMIGKDVDTMSDPKVSIVEMEEGLPLSKLPRKTRRQRAWSVFKRAIVKDEDEQSPWPKLVRWGLIVFTILVGLFAASSLIFHSLLIDLARRLSPPAQPTNGLTTLVSTWVEPQTSNSTVTSWLPGFSRDVTPKAIHSHNDYWRQVPLFQALSLGITGVEADCHLVNGELYVGHSNASLRPNRTFRTLYINPLLSILQNQNKAGSVAPDSSVRGVWDTDASRGIVLMTDLKTEGFSTLEAVQAQLQPLRDAGWLSYWNGTTFIPGPITHVGTGNTPFAAVLNSTYANATYRDVFFDAPIDQLSSIYNASNSYYTSTSLSTLLGGNFKIPQTGLSKSQMITVAQQITQAKELGLVSRYWDIPTWPTTRRMNIWKQLESLDVGMLNADAIEQAARWNWRWCNILGLQLC